MDKIKAYEYLNKIIPFFPKAKLYGNFELILIPKINLYFLLENINEQIEFDCKMIEWLSRPSHKDTSKYWQDYILRGLNCYFKQIWTKEDMHIIYTKLGNGVNRTLCIDFILGNFNINILNRR